MQKAQRRTRGALPQRGDRAKRLLAGAAALLVALSGLVVLPATAAQAESNVSTTRAQAPGTWFSYVKAGERFYSKFSFSQEVATGYPMKNKVVVTDPAGNETECTTVVSFGQTCEFLSEPATQDGVWTAALVQDGQAAPPGKLARNPLYWTVEPRSEAGEPALGRTWTEFFSLEDRTKTTKLSLWYQTEFGYTYSIDFQRFRGINSTFAANAFGNVNADTCASVYHSLATGLNNPKPGFAPVPATSCDFSPDKIFFSEPDASMPASVTLPDGSSTWLLVPLEAPTITLESFTPTVMGARAGTLVVSTEGFEGNAELYIDANGDGTFTEEGVDRHESIAVLSDGTGRFVFDGKDGAGRAIPQNVPIAFRVGIEKLGEVHFLLEDAEELDDGLVVTRHNGLSSPGGTTVFWNDEPLQSPEWDRQALIKCGIPTSPLAPSPVSGVPSEGGVRGWKATGCADLNGHPSNTTNGGSWGNNRAMDTWAYELISSEKPIQETMDIPGFTVAKSSTPAPGSTVAVGDAITYQVTASLVPYPHPGEISQAAQFWNGRYSDDLTGVLDDASVDLTALTSVDQAGQPVPAEHVQIEVQEGGQLWTWNGTNIPVATTDVTTSYTATVKDLVAGKPQGDGHLLNVAFAHDTMPPPPFPESCVENPTGLCGSTEHLAPVLQIEKSADPIRETPVLPGELVSYTLTFRNGGDVSAEVAHRDWLGGVLDDATRSGPVVVTPENALSVAESADTLDISGTISPGDTVTVSYDVRIDDPAKPGADGILSNFLLPEPEEPGTTPVCSDGDLSCTTHFVPGISLEKRFDGGPAGSEAADWEDLDGSGTISVGDLISFRFTVTNTGTTLLNPIVVSDPMLAEFGIEVRCDATELAPNAQTECRTSAGYEVTAADAAAQTVHNEATVVGSNPEHPDTQVTSSDTEDVPIAQVAPGISIAKGLNETHGEAGIEDVNGNGLPDAGDLIWYAFDVANTGDTVLTDVTVTDPLLEAADIAVTCEPNELGIGEAVRCVADAGYPVTAEDVQAGVLLNVATVTGVTPGENVEDEDDHTIPLVAANPELTLAKFLNTDQGGAVTGAPEGGVSDLDESGTVSVGDTIWYGFTVSNSGNVTIRDLSIADPLLSAAGITVVCDPATLAPLATARCVAEQGLTITEDLVEGGLLQNVATAVGVDPEDGEVESSEAETQTPVLPTTPDLTLLKEVDDEQGAGLPGVPDGGVEDVNANGIVDAGDLVWYRFTLTNTGNVPLNIDAVNDQMLQDAGISVSCPAQRLAPTESTVCRADAGYPISAVDAAAGLVLNTATATGSTLTGVPVPANEDHAEVPIQVAQPSLVLEKRLNGWNDLDGSGFPSRGDLVHYRFLVTNNGNVPVADIAITDAMLAGAEVSITCTPTVLQPTQQAVCESDAGYPISADQVTAGFVENVAVATGVSSEDPEVVSNESEQELETHRADAELALVKRVDAEHGIVDLNENGITDEGDLIWYEFEVTNTGMLPLDPVTVQDPLLDAAGIQALCPSGSLAPGATVLCRSDAGLPITAAQVESGSVDNVATAHGTTLTGAQVASPESEVGVPTEAASPSLELRKDVRAITDVDGSQSTTVGDLIVWSFAVSNTGNVPITGLLIDDPLLANVGVSIACPVTELDPGVSTVCVSEEYEVTEADLNSGAVHNVATATGTTPGLPGEPGTPVESGEDETTTSVVPVPETPEPEKPEPEKPGPEKPGPEKPGPGAPTPGAPSPTQPGGGGNSHDSLSATGGTDLTAWLLGGLTLLAGGALLLSRRAREARVDAK